MQPGNFSLVTYFFFPCIFISWRLITLQYYSGFCHTLTWISDGFTCVPYPDPPSRLPPHPIPLGLPSAPALSTCLMHPTWAGDLFHPWQYTCFNAILSEHPTLAFSHGVYKVCSVRLCLFFCFAYRVIVTYFIHISVYMSTPVSQFTPFPLGFHTFVLRACVSISRFWGLAHTCAVCLPGPVPMQSKQWTHSSENPPQKHGQATVLNDLWHSRRGKQSQGRPSNSDCSHFSNCWLSSTEPLSWGTCHRLFISVTGDKRNTET